jgi:hypothetical protein
LLTLKSPSAIRFLLHVSSRRGQSASQVAIWRSSGTRSASFFSPEDVQNDERQLLSPGSEAHRVGSARELALEIRGSHVRVLLEGDNELACEP